MSVLWNIFLFLVTPHKTESKEQYSVRLILTILVVVTGLSQLAHLVWAAENFVQKGDVEELLINDITEKIISAKMRQCEARKDTDTTSEAKQFFSRRLNEQQDRYYKQTGHYYNIPDCKDLV